MSFKVDVHNLKNFSDREKARLTMGLKELERILVNEDLWKGVAKRWHDWDDKYYMDSNGRKREYQNWRQFKNQLLSGADKFNPKNDGDLDLYLTLYYSMKNVVGYTYPSTWWTWTNRKYFKKFDDGEIAGHVVHEYLHNMGLSHPNMFSSLTYQFGYLVRDMINKKELKPSNPRRTKRAGFWTRVKRKLIFWR